MDRNGFIDGLVASHGRRPPLPRPGRRCWRWFLGAAVVTGALLGLIQPYRPGCLHQLCICPRLLVETLAALLLSALGVYMLFVKSVPGERLSSAVRFGAAALGLVLAGSLVFDALNVPAEASAAGARHACWLEVLLYGGLALIALLLMARRAMLRFSPLAACVFGLVAGLVPAALMQLACMYHPYHGLVCHFGPVLILVVLSLLLTKCLAD